MCVRKLASRMLSQSQIQILLRRWIPVKFHSNYSENSVCVRKNIQIIFWEAEAYVTLGLCPYVFINKLIPLQNSHSKDELQSSLQWSFKLRIFSCV